MNEKALEDLLNSPTAMIGVLATITSCGLFLWVILTYPSICHFGMYESNVTTMIVKIGYCKPQKFIDERPNWLQNVLTLGTGNIALVNLIIILILIVALVYINKKKKRLECKHSSCFK